MFTSYNNTDYSDIFSFFKYVNEFSYDPERLIAYVRDFAREYFSLKDLEFFYTTEYEKSPLKNRIYYPVFESNRLIGYFFTEKSRDIEINKAAYRNFFSIVSVIIENSYLKFREKKLFSDIVDVQLKLLNARTEGGEMHSKNVQVLALAISEDMNLSVKEKEALKIGGLLFDVGKIGIPDYILNLEEPLPADCQKIIMEHVYYGRQIIGNFSTITDTVKDIAFYHHEMIDGSGYPEGLKGDSIPLTARIITVCDVFCTLTERRVYRNPLEKEVAFEKIRVNSNRLYDKQIVDSLEKVVFK